MAIQQGDKETLEKLLEHTRQKCEKVIAYKLE